MCVFSIWPLNYLNTYCLIIETTNIYDVRANGTFFLCVNAGEAAKWEKITYVGIVACSVLAFVNLSKGHPHFDEPPVSPNF